MASDFICKFSDQRPDGVIGGRGLDDHHRRVVSPFYQAAPESGKLPDISASYDTITHIVPEKEGFSGLAVPDLSLVYTDRSQAAVHRPCNRLGVHPIAAVIDYPPVSILDGKISDIKLGFVAGVITVNADQFIICWKRSHAFIELASLHE
jgi:hypothetical protein